MLGTCEQTVSILYAIVFGAEGACISIGLWSILSAFAAFMLLVVLAQWVARRIWTRLRQEPSDMGEDIAPPYAPPVKDDPKYKDSAIRSGRR